MSSLHHENILEDCFEVAMESFRINNQLTHEQLDELITISKGTYDAICSNAYKLFQDRVMILKNRQPLVLALKLPFLSQHLYLVLPR